MKQTEHEVDYKLMEITSTAFSSGSMIPEKYTCEGKNISPPLDIKGIPLNAISLVIIMEDPDAPGGTWVHWLVWNIPVTHHIKENEVHGTEGLNDFGKHNYGGPCPPSGTHRYFIKVYALDCQLNLPDTTNRSQLEEEMSGNIIAYGELMGIYQKSNH